MNILVIEDDHKMRIGLVELLKNEGNQVDSAENGQLGLKEIEKKDYDIVLTDLIMPIVGGMDVLKEVKRKNSNTQVIIITAYATIENAVEAVKAGAAEYITKPFKVDEVQTKIRKAVVEADFVQGPQVIGSDVIKGLSNPIRKEVVTILERKKQLRFTDIKNILKIDDASKLSFHLRILKKLNIIDQDKEKIYSLTTRGYKLIKAMKSSDY